MNIKLSNTDPFRLRGGVWGGRQALGRHVLRREKAILRTGNEPPTPGGGTPAAEYRSTEEMVSESGKPSRT